MKATSTLWRTRRLLSRLPPRFGFAALCGAVTLLVLQAVLHYLSTTSHYELPPRPRPLVVVAAGLPRTGSTWVYNVLRILVRKRDPNSVAGWYADLISIWKNHKTGRYDNMTISWLDAYRSLNTTLLLKMHGPGPFKLFSKGLRLGHAADLTVTTHRDLRTEVRSWVYQNWNSSIHSGDIAKTPFGDPAQWVRVAIHILKERRSTLRSIGEGRFLDIRYENWTGKDPNAQMAVIKAMAAELDWDFSSHELYAAAVEAARLEAPATGAVFKYNPANNLHPGHMRLDADDHAFQKALSDGYRAIEEDQACREFLKSKNYM